MHMSAVIGANYGDEGKGRTVDWLCQEGKEALVVRYNGGAQAGHTVVTPEGRRHVFHHFGSGTLRGAATFLDSHFLLNPVIFVEEYQKLKDLNPIVHCDIFSKVTTPWDMAINQELERSRGNSRHGSCGLGIHETVVRSQRDEFALDFYFLRNRTSKGIAEFLRRIRYDWVPQRLLELKLPASSLNHINIGGLIEHFLEDVKEMLKVVQFNTPLCALAAEYKHVIFEGAQGLRLDEDGPDFPHVTCSKTGLPNIIEDLGTMQDPPKLNIYYVTRPYLTRHGAGPLKNEIQGNLMKVVDPTNVPNEFQGTIRYGGIDVRDFAGHIYADLMKADRAKIQYDHHLVMTCVDQPGPAIWYNHGRRVGDPRLLLADLIEATGALSGHVFSNPARSDSLTF